MTSTATSPDTAYALVALDPSGDIFALRYLDNGHGTITGVCGPLHYTEQDSPGADYDYDTDPDVLDQWNAVGSDVEGVGTAYRHVKDLA